MLWHGLSFRFENLHCELDFGAFVFVWIYNQVATKLIADVLANTKTESSSLHGEFIVLLPLVEVGVEYVLELFVRDSRTGIFNCDSQNLITRRVLLWLILKIEIWEDLQRISHHINSISFDGNLTMGKSLELDGILQKIEEHLLDSGSISPHLITTVVIEFAMIVTFFSFAMSLKKKITSWR